MTQPKLIGVRNSVQPDPRVQNLIEGAARAIEVHSEDELERHAAEQRKLEEQLIVCGVSLPGNVHAILKTLSKEQKKALKQVALEHIIGAIWARHVLLRALQYHEHDGHYMPKEKVREALALLGVSRENQP